MFYDEAITISRCEDEPSVIFTIIKEEYMDLVDKILYNEENKYDKINIKI